MTAELYATREEWLAARHATPGQIGASEVACALGVSPFRGPWDLFAANGVLDLPDEIAPEIEEDKDAAEDPSDPLVRGNLWEPFVRTLAGRFLGRPVLAPGEPFGAPDALVIVRHPVFPWLGASPDGWVYDDDGALCPVELKTDAGRRGWNWGKSGTTIREYIDGAENIVPPHYYTQNAVQISAANAPRGYLFVLQGSYRSRWFRIQRDHATEIQLLRRVNEWRQRHLIDCIEPDRDASDACARHYRERYANKGTAVRPAVGVEVDWIEDIAAHKAAEKAAKLARVNLSAAMGEAHNCLTLSPIGGKIRGVRRDVRGVLSSFNLTPE